MIFSRIHILFLTIYSIISSHAWAALPQKVVICGVCQNIESTIAINRSIMERIGSLFEDYRIIIYENNSTDNTVRWLKKWANKNHKVRLITQSLPMETLKSLSVNHMPDGSPFRPEMIARARNIVLKEAMSESYEPFSFLIWMDMDFQIHPRLEGLIETFETKREWDAVFAYGMTKSNDYWDWYALRYSAFPFGPELSPTWYQMGRMREEQFTLSAKDDWFPVYSAFGGLGIYRKSSIQGCSYSALVTEDVEVVYANHLYKGELENHPAAIQYREDCRNVSHALRLFPGQKKYDRLDPNTGIVLSDFQEPLLWRVNSKAYEYPSLCEHIPFHASMIRKGHDKLFINPRLVFIYGASE